MDTLSPPGLPAGYQVDVDQVSENEWYDILQQFEDASFYQTWAYGVVRWGRENLSHLLLRRDNKVVAAAQVRIIKLPIVPGGIAYVRWGGIWRRRGEYSSPHEFRYLLRAMREEYAVRRKLYLRVIPNILDINAQLFVDILQQEGFQQTYFAEVGRTINMDLRYSLKDIRAGMQSRWRNYLKRAEKSNLQLIKATPDELYDVFVNMYAQMHQRKGFVDYVDVHEYRDIQRALPEALKMKILAAELNGEPQAAIICAIGGHVGIYVLGATSDEGLKSRSSYWLHWKMMEWLKEQGYLWYDLGGINPVKVPGTAQFKYGMAGKTGIDSHPIGQFDMCLSVSSGVFVPLLDKLRNVFRALRAWQARV